MSHNSFGRVFRFATWGESHGPAIGAVIDGCPPGLTLTEDDIQPVARPAPPRPLAEHLAPPGAGPGPDPLRNL
jgi:hypothetical protein